MEENENNNKKSSQQQRDARGLKEARPAAPIKTVASNPHFKVWIIIYIFLWSYWKKKNHRRHRDFIWETQFKS